MNNWCLVELMSMIWWIGVFPVYGKLKGKIIPALIYSPNFSHSPGRLIFSISQPIVTVFILNFSINQCIPYPWPCYEHMTLAWTVRVRFRIFFWDRLTFSTEIWEKSDLNPSLHMKKETKNGPITREVGRPKLNPENLIETLKIVLSLDFTDFEVSFKIHHFEVSLSMFSVYSYQKKSSAWYIQETQR